MKNKYKYRKQFQEIANRIGLLDETVLASMADQVNKKQYNILVNNHRRFVNGHLAHTLERQRQNLIILKNRIAEAEAAHAEKVAKESNPLTAVQDLAKDMKEMNK